MTKSQEKYARKVHASGEVATGESAHHLPYLGVRTRAKTLALKCLQESSPVIAASYLQLRSRRLKKQLHPSSAARSRASAKHRFTANPSGSARSEVGSNQGEGTGEEQAKTATVNEAAADDDDDEIEASHGENPLELDTSRSTRETTPCSMIMESKAIGTPGSATRPNMYTAKNKKRTSASCSNPTAREMEELFAGPEQILQQNFLDKYNFDVVKDRPVPGRYEWLQLDS